MSFTKVYLFSAGFLESEKQYFTLGRGQGVPYNVPVPIYYLEHEMGKKYYLILVIQSKYVIILVHIGGISLMFTIQE